MRLPRLESELKVAYLGPRGTFSEQAMIRQFGSGVVGMPSGSIEEVFRKVESGDAAYGIVPIENSTEGAVNRTMDYLLKTSLFHRRRMFHSDSAQLDDAAPVRWKASLASIRTLSLSDNASSAQSQCAFFRKTDC